MIIEIDPAEHKEKAVCRDQLPAGIAGKEHYFQNKEHRIGDVQPGREKAIPRQVQFPHETVHKEHVKLKQHHRQKEHPAADRCPRIAAPAAEQEHFIAQPGAHFLRKAAFCRHKRPHREPNETQGPADQNEVKITVDAGGK